ncbi:hypothetical protein RvY_17422 [Ramazzottius varieornatus]|uniref:HTH CENPB-type domain-containing protein n=1 Tax=Ramazzottius varieornatus TaxID=947166 RepID=A0A1D1W227_RAMVA|nr:hypothetical protein RvY_17422 [Ramazzottius varieornatus]
MAVLFAESEEISEFRASKGWLRRFCKRHGYNTKILHGEGSSADVSALEKWYNDDLPNILLEFDLKDIWNADELGLLYRQFPNKSLVGEEGTPKGVKLKKERITVLLTGNALGERFPVWLVGKSVQPRAFTKAGVSRRDTIKHIFYYRLNSTSWMTGKIFSEFLEELNKKMISQERRIALIVDKFSGHKVNETSNIRLFFLPPNCTSKAKPFDAGIIKSFKDHFRRRMCHDVYAKRESFKTAEGYFKGVTV